MLHREKNYIPFVIYARHGIEIIDNVINEREYCFYNDADESIICILPVRYHNTYSTVSDNIVRCLNFLFYIINQKYRYSQLTLRP